MKTHIALLRAVNVGGTGKLPMSVLVSLCEDCGFTSVRTYIASGNVIFKSRLSPARIKAALEEKLHSCAGKPVGVLLRTADELTKVLEVNPFPEAAPSRTVAIFLDEPPPPGFAVDLSGRAGEEIAAGTREIYVHYGDGMGHSKLKIPAARHGTARNMNTIRKLVEIASDAGSA